MKYENHQYADIFPMMSEAEIKDLADDIKANGLSDPIVLHEGKVLDGRNRHKACLLAKVEPRFVQYDGPDPLGFVVSHNLKRRHLTTPQRSMVAAKIADLPHGGAYKIEGSIDPSKSTQKAADMMKVSPASVKRAKSIQRAAIPEVQDMVESGELSLNAGKKIAALPEEQQRKAVAGGVAKVKEAAKKAAMPFADNIHQSELTESEKSDSYNMMEAKRIWKKLSKNEKKDFMNWVKQNN